MHIDELWKIEEETKEMNVRGKSNLIFTLNLFASIESYLRNTNTIWDYYKLKEELINRFKRGDNNGDKEKIIC